MSWDDYTEKHEEKSAGAYTHASFVFLYIVIFMSWRQLPKFLMGRQL